MPEQKQSRTYRYWPVAVAAVKVHVGSDGTVAVENRVAIMCWIATSESEAEVLTLRSIEKTWPPSAGYSGHKASALEHGVTPEEATIPQEKIDAIEAQIAADKEKVQ